MVVEGCHVLMESCKIRKFMEGKIFIDSDSDVRLSRRVFKDTQINHITLEESIANYKKNIKPNHEN
jgi:uridine kinase